MYASVASSLRRPGAILLVSCYEMGHQPLALASPCGFLVRAGYEPVLLDVAVEPLDADALRAARFVGISVPMHTALRLGVRVARRVRELNPGAHVCFYGLYAPLHAGYLQDGLADSVLGGECEAALVDLVERLDAGAPPDTTPITLAKLDFAVPHRAQLPPLARYARLEHAGASHLAGYVEASRGCLHRCRHCPIPAVYDGKIFIVPVELVLEDVRAQVRAGARHITFGDPDFLNGPSHAERVARAVHAEFPDLTWDFTAKVEHLLQEPALLPEFASLGALFMVTAVESLSDVVLAHLDKDHTRADVFAALELLRDAGIAMRPSFMPFTPWSTLDDYLDVLDWIEREDLVHHVDTVQLTIRLLVPPGSLLLQSEAMRPHLGPLDPEALTYRWTHPDPRMDALHRDAAEVVSHAAGRNEDASIAFARLRHLALAHRDGRITPFTPASSSPARHASQSVPHLTEPWFC